jgi:ElaB/YqjD/DUF883 family membrane-anchored ribosome-binding protein
MEESAMADHPSGYQQAGSSSDRESAFSKARDTAGQAFSKASEMARDAGEKAKRAAADTASTMGDEVKTILDRQLGTGATMAGQFASSIRIAADDLSRESPMLAGLVRGFADRVDGYAQDLQDQTVDQVMRAASDFTRKQPALVFGLAALAGFFVLRTFKSAGENAAPSIQPSQDPAHPRDYNG